MLYRKIRANVRYHFGYTPDVLEKMTIQQLAEAWSDLQYMLQRINQR